MTSAGVILTVAREHGSSGKQIAKIAAEKLGVPFYYKEMIALAAHESGLDREFISDINKNSPDVLRDLYLSSHAVRYAVEAQNRIIRKIADNGSCVIVGRAADYVLREYDNVLRVFVRAPLDFRIRRVGEVYGDTPVEAGRNIRRSDRARASYYRHISGRKWGAAENYDLIVDSSSGIEASAEEIVREVLRRGTDGGFSGNQPPLRIRTALYNQVSAPVFRLTAHTGNLLIRNDTIPIADFHPQLCRMTQFIRCLLSRFRNSR